MYKRQVFRIETFSSGARPVDVEIYAVDLAGNRAFRECSLYIDGEAPEVSITGVQDYMITSQPVELHFAAREENVFRTVLGTVDWEAPDGGVKQRTVESWTDTAEGKAGTVALEAVSYTHLDVYKRQAQKEFTQYFPKPGWVEHNADEIWSTQLGVAVEAMSKIGASSEDIAALGITNQRETAIVWDKKTGEPVCNAIVWQCRRTAEYCDQLKEKGYTEMIRKKTGLIIDAYFSATKIKWILDHVEGARERAERGELLFGTVETLSLIHIYVPGNIIWKG